MEACLFIMENADGKDDFLSYWKTSQAKLLLCPRDVEQRFQVESFSISRTGTGFQPRSVLAQW